MSAWNRWPAVVAVSALGVGLGLCADLIDGPVRDVLTALLLAPVAVTVGAYGVTIPELHLPLLIGGCLFWPGYALLCWSWARQPSRARLVMIGLWCLQGFFQLEHRVAGILSV